MSAQRLPPQSQTQALTMLVYVLFMVELLQSVLIFFHDFFVINVEMKDKHCSDSERHTT